MQSTAADMVRDDEEAVSIPTPALEDADGALPGADSPTAAEAKPEQEPEQEPEASTSRGSASASRQTRSTAEREAEDGSGRQDGPTPKRPRRDEATRARGMRMFGLVTSTLKKVANENEKRMTGEAGKRRAEIEERLKQKLQRETDELHARASLEKVERAELAELARITNAIVLGEADFRVRKAQKRRLASFLCAKVDVSRSTLAPPRRDGPSRRPSVLGGATESEYLSTADYATDLPFGLEPLREGALYPTYYLPAKLLPSQEDILDEQEDRVDRLIDDAETEWRQRKKQMEQRSKEIRDRIKQRRAGSNGPQADAINRGSSDRDRKRDHSSDRAVNEEKSAGATAATGATADDGPDTADVTMKDADGEVAASADPAEGPS